MAAVVRQLFFPAHHCLTVERVLVNLKFGAGYWKTTWLKQSLRCLAKYFLELVPHISDAYIDETFCDDKDREIGRVGYEINFNRFFYQYVPPRKLADIDADLKQVEAEIAALLDEVTE